MKNLTVKNIERAMELLKQDNPNIKKSKLYIMACEYIQNNRKRSIKK